MGTEEIEKFFNYMSKEELELAYSNIITIKNMCQDFSLLKPLKIPSLTTRIPKATEEDVKNFYDYIPFLKTFMEDSDYEDDHKLCKLIIDKLNEDERLRTKESYDEINDNLRITWVSSNVNKAHWSSYFVNLQKIIDVCWEAGTLVGPGRGSGVGFYLLYILDIIQINPMWESTKTFSWRLTERFKSLLCLATDLK